MSDRRTFLKSSLIGLPLIASTDGLSQKKTDTIYRKPLVVSTWDSGIRANAAAWKLLEKGGKAVDGVEQAARSAEDEASCCVGLEAYPDRDGYVTLDASIMDNKGGCG